MHITFVKNTTENTMLHPNADGYDQIIAQITTWQPSAKNEDRYGRFKAVVNATYTVYGNVQLCEGFCRPCSEIVIHHIEGYKFCTRCAREYAGYTPEFAHTIVYT